VEDRSSRPALLTFDIFGTVIDWEGGLWAAARSHGIEMTREKFQAVIDHQARAEQGSYRSYAGIVAESLVEVLRMKNEAARAIAAEAGSWPLFEDSRDGLRRLMRIAPCVAMTNSDPPHGKQAQEQLGFRLSGWISAEDTRSYKPAPSFWRAVGSCRSVEFGPEWWHVSAYGDYDLDAAARLGLTTIFVERPHSVPGPSLWRVRGLRDLAERLEGLFTSAP
jgi:2-haloacid dehalogenase